MTISWFRLLGNIFRTLDLYNRILADLGYEISLEYEASQYACLIAQSSDLVEPASLIKDLRSKIRGLNTIVLGAGPSINKLVLGELYRYDVIMCADGVCRILDKSLCEEYRRICIYIGDLDGGIGSLENILSYGGYAFIHFHGSNYRDLLHYVPLVARRCRERIVFTTQVYPLCSKVVAIPGFTDGDRAILLAEVLGIRDLKLVGMDFDSEFSSKYSKPWYTRDTIVTSIKRRKLEWSERIIHRGFKDLVLERLVEEYDTYNR